MTDIDAKDIEALPFVRSRAKDELPEEICRRDFWDPPRTGDFDVDSHLGRQYAAQLLGCMARDDCPPLLGWVVCEMVRKGAFGPMEVCFLHAVSEAALKGCTSRSASVRSLKVAA